MKIVLTETEKFEENHFLFYFWNEYPCNKIIRNGNYIAGYQIIKLKKQKYFVTDSAILAAALQDGVVKVAKSYVDQGDDNVTVQTVEAYMKRIS